jgi:rhodanese-related sulfurtransferase
MGIDMIKWLVLMICSVAIGWALPLAAADRLVMEQQDLLERLGSEEVVVIDVRTGGDWRNSDRKIRGAIRENPGDVASWADRYDQRKTIVLYCA